MRQTKAAQPGPPHGFSELGAVVLAVGRTDGCSPARVARGGVAMRDLATSPSCPKRQLQQDDSRWHSAHLAPAARARDDPDGC